DKLIQRYQRQWRMAFGSRMMMGRWLQRFFGKPVLSNLFVNLFATFPYLASPIIKKTHGKPF
ncbi:MAG TPA: pyridine nucleotide-disulfide oxidoreductase, partial [Flavisolibacter sp.]|nr:pyridine nucleotide-disulfide oxidoreductase [Flavisolibacter sp.]